MSAHSAPTQPRVVAETAAEDHCGCSTGTATGLRTDSTVAMADVIVAPGSGRAWHIHPAPASVMSLEGDFAFLTGPDGHVRVVRVPPGASIHIPAELPHAYANTGHHRGRLFVAPATDLAGFSARSDLRTAGHVSAPEESPGAWRRILAQ